MKIDELTRRVALNGLFRTGQILSGVANPGARIQIRRFPLSIVTPLKACAFRISHNDLKVQDYGEAQRVYKMQYGRLPA